MVQYFIKELSEYENCRVLDVTECDSFIVCNMLIPLVNLENLPIYLGYLVELLEKTRIISPSNNNK